MVWLLRVGGGEVLFWGEGGEWENDRAGGLARREERMAAGNLWRVDRRYIPELAMVDVW